MNIKYKIAYNVSKLSKFILHSVLRRPGGFFPGKIALELDDNIIDDLQKDFHFKSVVVTGTNGKTSVTKLLTNCLQKNNYDVLSNDTGANLASGVATSLVSKKNLSNNSFCIFEIDELWVKEIISKINCKYLVLLNLFADQVDRTGGVRNVASAIIDALKSSPNTILVYNADDPNCQFVADSCNNPCVSFGLNQEICALSQNSSQNCPKCGKSLSYKIRQYAQLGNYRCSNCGFNRADLDFYATDIDINIERMKFNIDGKSFVSYKSAEYVLYNLLGFITCSMLLKCEYDTIYDTVLNQKNDNGRMQTFKIQEKNIWLNLAKNAVGFDQNINYIVNKILSNDKNTSDKSSKSMSIAFFVNAKEGDGLNTDWLLDVNFSLLKQCSDMKLFAGGQAVSKLKSCLKENNLDVQCVDSIDEVLSLSNQGAYVYIVANYTAMFPIRTKLMSLSKND